MCKLLRFEYASMTDQGCVREENADYIGAYVPASTPEQYGAGSLFLVADGVGSAEDGKKAGKIAVHHVFSNYYENSIVDPFEQLRMAIEQTNRELFTLSEKSGTEGSHATTIVAALVHREALIIAAVGDSRAYFIHDGKIEQVTFDHTLVNHLLQKGAITNDEAINHTKRNVIIRSLGVRASVKIDLFQRDPIPGDMVILCSDGLTRYLQTEELLNESLKDDIQLLPQKWIEMAKNRGGRDNISVNVIQFTGVEVL